MNVSRLLHQLNPDLHVGSHGLTPHRALNRLAMY